MLCHGCRHRDREDDPRHHPCRTARRRGTRRGRRAAGCRRRCAPVVGGSPVRHVELRCRQHAGGRQRGAARWGGGGGRPVQRGGVLHRRGDHWGAAGRGRRRTADAHARYPIGGRQPGSAVPECARIPDRGRAGPPRVRRTFPTSCRIHVTGAGLGGCRQARRMCHRWRRPLQERALRGRHRAGLCRARSRHERGSESAPTALGGEARPTARRGRGRRPRWCRAARLLRGQPARWVMPRIAS